MKESKVNIKQKRLDFYQTIIKQNPFVVLNKKYIVQPLISGIVGFVLFFFFTTIIDFIVNIYNSEKALSIDTFTILIALIGFFLAYIFKILEMINKDY